MNVATECIGGGWLAMAVCIVDVDNEHTPTIQYGNMYVGVQQQLLHLMYIYLAMMHWMFPAAGIASIRPSMSVNPRTEAAL